MNVEQVIIDMAVLPEIPTPPQELADFVHNLIDLGEPMMADNRQEGVHPLVLEEALLAEQQRQIQMEEDAALAHLLQDDVGQFEEADSGYTTESDDELQGEDEPIAVEAADIDSDAETVENNPARDANNYSESDSDGDSVDLDIDEVTLRRTMRVRQRFFTMRRGDVTYASSFTRDPATYKKSSSQSGVRCTKALS